MREHNVSLRKPNKRFAIENEDRVVRMKDYVQNIWKMIKYFLETYGIDPLLLMGTKCLYTEMKA